jgi:outer membrane protein assembly factor BamB
VSFAIDTGEMIWKHELGGSVVSSPVYAGSALVVGSTDGRVHGLALATWEHTGLSGKKSEE